MEMKAEERAAGPVMAVGEVARLFGCSKPTIYRRIQRGELPAIHFGKAVVVPRAKLEEMLGQKLP
jgi:excisionase family DNA binding protein